MTLLSSVNEQHSFQRPVFFTAVGQDLPAGTYDFTVEHHEILTGAGAHRYTNCTIHLPGMGPSWSLGVSTRIDYNELQQKLIEDKQPPKPAAKPGP